MKKFISWLLIVVICIALAACNKEPQVQQPQAQDTEQAPSYSVRSPMSYPDYTFDADPTTNQLRKTAVQAMRDLLSIQWCTPTEIKFKNDGANDKKIFHNQPGMTYGGLPYTYASTGIFYFFEYYDQKTGMLTFEGSSDELKYEIGCTCTDSLLWSCNTVANSFKGAYYPAYLVPENGYIPVGGYKIKEGIKSYREYPTYEIMEDNGRDAILEAYAQTLPADILVSTPDDHALMVIQKPVVLHLADGSIDAENSFLVIQDQRVGEYYDDNYGIGVPHYGRLSATYTFKQLYESKYIPVTLPEFTGEKAYDYASVTVSNTNCSNLDDLSDVTIESNYPLVLINLIGIMPDGSESVFHRIGFHADSMEGAARSYSMANTRDLNGYVPKEAESIRIEVVVSTGERFYPIEFSMK